MRLLLVFVALLVFLPQLVWADGNHLDEINRLSKMISEKNFEPVTVTTEGTDFAEALAKAAEIVSDHIGLRELSPETCTCLRNTKLIPAEQYVLLRTWDYTLTETTNGSVKLVIKLESRQLKQLALFEMWPLYGQDFLKKIST